MVYIPGAINLNYNQISKGLSNTKELKAYDGPIEYQ